MQDLLPLAEKLARRLTETGGTVGVGESSAGGLISAALLAVPGASAYYRGGAVVYTPKARATLVDIQKEALEGMRSASEPYALLLARTIRTQLAATWGVSETGASGPTGNPYGDAAGHSCLAVAGPVERVVTLETGHGDRVANMRAFAAAALGLLLEAVEDDIAANSRP